MVNEPARTTQDSIVERNLVARREALDTRVNDLIVACRQCLRDADGQDPPLNVILKQAKVPLRTFYRLFQSKDELLVAVLERGIDETLASADTPGTRDLEPPERIDRWVQGFVTKVYAEPGRLGASLLLHQSRLHQRFPTETDAMIARVAAPLADAIAQLRVEDTDATFDARLIYSMVSAYVCDRLGAEAFLTEDEVARLCSAARRIASSP